MTIKDRIFQKRKELGLTLDEVAKIVGVGKSTVKKWETGFIENMKTDKIELLAKALQTTPSYIMGWTDEVNQMPVNNRTNSKDEQDLLDAYNKLNAVGKQKALESVEDLTQIPKYIYIADLIVSDGFKKPVKLDEMRIQVEAARSKDHHGSREISLTPEQRYALDHPDEDEHDEHI